MIAGKAAARCDGDGIRGRDPVNACFVERMSGVRGRDMPGRARRRRRGCRLEEEKGEDMVANMELGRFSDAGTRRYSFLATSGELPSPS